MCYGMYCPYERCYTGECTLGRGPFPPDAACVLREQVEDEEEDWFDRLFGLAPREQE